MTEFRRRSLIWWNSAAMLATAGVFLLCAITCHQPFMHRMLTSLITCTSGLYLVLSPFALWAAIKGKYPPGILVAGYPMPILSGAILSCIMLCLAFAAPVASIVAFLLAFLAGIWTLGGALVAPLCAAVVVFDLATRPKKIETTVLGCGGRKHRMMPPPEVAS